MIRYIDELNFPEYATLTQASCEMQYMGEKTITTDVKIDGSVAPDFSYDWTVIFRGEKYIHPKRSPQVVKENTTLNSVISMTFEHWAVHQLKRYFFFEYASTETGTAIPNKYIVPLRLNLKEFCAYLDKVCEYYYGDKIRVDLNPKWEYAKEVTGIDISNSYVWDVLKVLYDKYAVSWQIEPVGDSDHYLIKVGYGSAEISHIFEYGFKGGLLRVEHQPQNNDIRNMLLGRGGQKNLPYRYFKDVDPDNPGFAPDPDWVPELRNILFSELRGKTFRDYVKGWKTNPHRQLIEKDGSAITPYPHDETVSAIGIEPYDVKYGTRSFAYVLGHTDTKFNPVEYVADKLVSAGLEVVAEKGSSIDRYGELVGALENNDKIYPSIQGAEASGLGRLDCVVDVEQIKSDDVAGSVEANAVLSPLEGMEGSVFVEVAQRREVVVEGAEFTIPQGQTGIFEEGTKTVTLSKENRKLVLRVIDGNLTGVWEVTQVPVDDKDAVEVETIVEVVDQSTGETVAPVGIAPGTYRPRLKFKVHNQYSSDLSVTIECPTPQLMTSEGKRGWDRTFNIWIKNIWLTEKGLDENGNTISESNAEYSRRVWGRILGDRLGNEAKVVFTSGELSVSEDYEFVIYEMPEYDTSKTLTEKDDEGNVTASYPSHWKLTLVKSDADYDATGLYVPSTKRQGKAGDEIFFIGIDMPHKYVLWAEERLDSYKQDQVDKISDIKPTRVVTLDKVRLTEKLDGEVQNLISQLREGRSVTLYDERFISGSHEQKLFIQSITYTFNESTDGNANLTPDVEVVLSDKYTATAGTVSQIQGSIEEINKQLGSVSNLTQIIRSLCDSVYLRKDGAEQRSVSPTEFAGILSGTEFRSGIIGGRGWGIFKDENGNTVIEADRFRARQDFEANTYVINQAKGRGGMIVDSAAVMEITRVVETAEGYICYFDQKNGSVANTFEVDDVAMCQRYAPANGSTKYYRRRVVECGPNYISLTKGYEEVDLDDGTKDTGVNGSGVPEENDIVVQFGNYRINSGRTYVRIQDVVGGGYSRYLEGLTSVNASGREYFFAGRQSGQYGDLPRLYVGDDGGFLEWKGRKLRIKGEIDAESTIDGVTLGSLTVKDYIRKALLQSTTINGGLMLTSLIQLGFYDEAKEFVTKSGINGLLSPQSKGMGLALWAGGKMVDKAEDNENGAAAAVRHDGTAYFSDNIIRFDESGMQAGDNIRLDTDGLHLMDGLQESLTVTNSDVDIEQYIRPIFNENIILNIDDLTAENLDLVERDSLIIVGPVAPEPVTEVAQTSAAGTNSDISDAEYPGIGINPPMPIPDIYYVNLKNEWSRIIWSGSNENTMNISVSGKIAVKMGGATFKRKLYSAAYLDIINNGNVVKSQVVQLQGVGSDYSAMLSIQGFAVPETGNVSVRVTLTAGSGETSPAYGKLTCGLTGTASHGAPAMTLLGRNGIAFSRDNVVFAANDSAIVFKAGRAGLYLKGGQLLKTLDGENWRPIDDYHIETLTPASQTRVDVSGSSHTAIVNNSISNANVALPKRSAIANVLGATAAAPFSYELCIISSRNSSKSFNLWGRNSSISGMNNAEYPEMLDDSGETLASAKEVKSGRITKWNLIFDGTDYYAVPVDGFTKVVVASTAN